MSKNNRKAQIAKEAKAEERRINRMETALLHTVKRYYYGVTEPEKFCKQSVSLRLIALMPTIIDNLVADVEVMAGVPCRDPEMLKRIRALQRPLESLLNYCRNDIVDLQEYAGADSRTAEKFANEWCDVANFLQTVMEHIVLWSFPGSEWRCNFLMDTMNKLCTEEGQKSIEDVVVKYCRQQLELRHIDVDAALKAGVKAEDIKAGPDFTPMETAAKMIVAAKKMGAESTPKDERKELLGRSLLSNGNNSVLKTSR